MNIPCGTNCQVNAQLFDLQRAYKAIMKGIILYWLINAFFLSVQLAICQTSAHHWGHKYDLLSYCLPFVPRGLESSADSLFQIKLLTLRFQNCGDFADQEYWIKKIKKRMISLNKVCSFWTLSSINEAFCGNVWELSSAFQWWKRHLIHSIPAFITAINRPKKSRYLCLCKWALLLVPFPADEQKGEKKNGSVYHQLPLIALPWQEFWKLFIFSSRLALRWLLCSL